MCDVSSPRPGLTEAAGVKEGSVPLTLVILLAGLALALLVYTVSGGHFFFLPLVLLFPLGFFFRRRG
jgi:hypothetical protein